MKRANAMSGEELRSFITDSNNNDDHKRVKTDFLEEAIQLSVSAGFKDRDELMADLMSLRDRLVKFLRPMMTVGPHNSFFYFYIQGKKICVVTPNQICYNRRDHELLHFLESAAINMYPEVAYQSLYQEIVKSSDGFNLRKMSDPQGLIHSTDFLPKFLGFLMGFEFVKQ